MATDNAYNRAKWIMENGPGALVVKSELITLALKQLARQDRLITWLIANSEIGQKELDTARAAIDADLNREGEE